MSTKTNLNEQEIKKIKEIQDSFSELPKEKKINILKKMLAIRKFETQTEQFIIRGKIHGTCHLYFGVGDRLHVICEFLPSENGYYFLNGEENAYVLSSSGEIKSQIEAMFKAP